MFAHNYLQVYRTIRAKDDCASCFKQTVWIRYNVYYGIKTAAGKQSLRDEIYLFVLIENAFQMNTFPRDLKFSRRAVYLLIKQKD